jgi:hypothetical protein
MIWKIEVLMKAAKRIESFRHSSSLSREELAETGDEAGFLTIGSLPGLSPSPFLINNEWRALAYCVGRRSRLSDYSGGTVWDLHPLPFYPYWAPLFAFQRSIKKPTIPPDLESCQTILDEHLRVKRLQKPGIVG